jgi:hypothetical protein
LDAVAASILFIRLARWKLTALRLMWSSSVISSLAALSDGHYDCFLPVGQGDECL